MPHDNAVRAPARKGRPRGFDRDEALKRALEVFWERGYEPASVAELCSAMGIKPPSLYAAFGNKAKLFLEAVNYYEEIYWAKAWDDLETSVDLHMGVDEFFQAAAHILSAPDAPCGCMVVLSAINVSPESVEVIDALRAMRMEGRECFKARLARGIEQDHLPASTDISALAAALNTVLEGMAIQARDGDSQAQLKKIAALAQRMIPARPD
ncbi:TetR/AcrR family transcriptional regulator [Pseudomonas putida]|uniref:TetR/AcrR family transcriptional regulator n=1 Tax=Pseudomonas putida TaxID=303 RepID=A0A8I1EE71_PSEPU|nr:TetR/AcrR family transcriptional regulator [Pseudomonas putida]MBI6884985.1 TetR/AcrR family transcriptional regulator [Pseudomonas putida]